MGAEPLSIGLFRFAVLLLGLLPGTAAALTLGEAVGQAEHSDPAYLAAKSGLDVTEERARQAHANLTPQLTASASRNSNQRDYSVQNARPNGATYENYNSSSVQVNLTQPLFHHASFIAMKQAILARSQAGRQLDAAGQDLLVRLAQAWFDSMQARDEAAFSDAQLNAARAQWETANRNAELGMTSPTEREDARAKYEQAMADRVAANSNLEIRLAALEQILGAPVAGLPEWSAGPPELEEPGNTLGYWLDKAERGNPALLAAQYALESAEEEIRKQRAGHEPTLDFVASRSKTSQGSGLVGGQAGFSSSQSSVGFQLNLPLFSGGLVIAKTGEAAALRDKAQHEREAALRSARLSVRQAWFSWQAGYGRYLAAQQQIRAAEAALKGAGSAKALGVKTELDVLKAQQQKEGASRDLRKARYEMIVSHCKLKAAAGELRGDDLSALDKLFGEDGESIPAPDAPDGTASAGEQAGDAANMAGTTETNGSAQ